MGSSIKYSKLGNLVKAAILCSSTWLLVFFLVLCNESESAPGVLRLVPHWLLPQLSWLVFPVYIFFPCKRYFTGNVSSALSLLFIELWSSLRAKLAFVHKFTSTQLFSFVILVEDAFYCLFFTIDRLSQVHFQNRSWDIFLFARVFAFAFVFIILVLKMAQNSNQIYFAKERSESTQAFLELGTYFLLLVSLVLTLIWSFLYVSILPQILMVCLVTLASFLFDAVFSFGFVSISKVKGEHRKF